MNSFCKISTNYAGDVLDEISLEGLDGITTETLWVRLSVRPNFSFKLDEHSKKFLWNLIISMSDVQFYEIPEPRPVIKYYNYAIAEDSQKAALELDELYPYYPLKNVPGVYGSCQHYSTRIDITSQVINLSLKEAEEKWGDKLVMVASQESRNISLMGTPCFPEIDFSKSLIQYDILERVGRCRQLGLATWGKGSIQTVVEDSKSVFHYLKVLCRCKLIRKQSLLGSLQNHSNASKVHLTRFSEECLNENMFILQTAIEELKGRPNNMMPCDEFYALFGPEKRNRIRKYKKTLIFKKYIAITKNLPYRSFFPDASQSEWERKSKNGERVVRCFKLINPDIEFAEIIDKDCEPDDEEGTSGFLPKGVYYSNIPIVIQAYHHIKNSGTAGMSHFDLAMKMGLNKSFVRALLKRLELQKFCKVYIESDGRRRCKRYMVGEDSQTKAAATEIAQMLSKPADVHIKLEAEITNDQPEAEPKTVGKVNLPQLQEENMSYRTLRRIGLIIKTIKANRFRLFHQIMKFIAEEEVKEGLTSKVDRVTITRLLKKLEKDELIKTITLTSKETDGHVVKLYAEPTFEPDEKLAETLYHSQSPHNITETKGTLEGSQINLESEYSYVLMENLAEMRKMLKGVKRKSDKLKIEESKQSELVYSSKFIRLSIIHELIFHLVYAYNGTLDKKQEEMIEELSKTTAVDDDLKKEMPKLYGTQLTTYMFVPPLCNPAKRPGWFLVSDLLIRMPLSIIVKIFKVPETCPEVWTYLHHPIRKHFLVKDLPLAVRQIFFSRKNQINSLYCDLRRLCFMGLIQFGLRFGREQYQTFAYLNRKASLLDTSTSPPEYYQVPADMTFEVKPYVFNAKSDVKRYWTDMFNICLATNLGVKTNVIGKEILAERELGKESLKKLIEPKTVEQAAEDDNGELPGDRLGAAGLDSVMFSFLRSNWTGPVSKTRDKGKEKKVIKVPLQTLKKDQVKRSRYFLKSTRWKKVAVKTEKVDPSVVEEEPRVGRLRKVKKREVRLKTQGKTMYDETDLEALKLMNTLRVTWSTAEDNLLLICRVAIMFLCPNTRNFVRIPWVEVRRVLQKHLPESRNKTQRAVARRIIYMLKNPTTVRSVSLCLEELKEMPEAKQFDCVELLNTIKPSAPNLAELQSRLYEKFQDLVAFLKDRFIENTSLNVQKKDKDLIPDTLEEFLDKFRFEVPPEVPVNIKTIRENVIRGILMSWLSCRADKTSSAVQLFEIYRQYDDDELHTAVKKLHNDKVITISKKVGRSIFKNGKHLPLSFSPYKFSFAFQHLLNMKCNHSIFSDTYFHVTKLLERDSNEDFEVDLNECNVSLFLLASMGMVSFKTILPEQVIAINSEDLSDATYSKMFERYCEMLRLSHSNSKVLCSSGKIISNETLEVGDVRKRSLEGGEEGCSAKKPKMDKEVEATVNVKAEPTVVESEQCSDKPTRSSRVILYIMREEAKKDANESGRLAQEFCVVNASKVLSRVGKDDLETYTKTMEPKVVTTIIKSITSRSLVPINLVDEDSIGENYADDHLKALKDTLDFICSKKELGTTSEELRLHIRHPLVGRMVRQLVETKIVIKSGISETRYISQKYCTPWLLNSFRMTRLEREKVKPNELTAVALTEPGDEVPRKKMKGVINSEELKGYDYTPPACSTDINNKIKIIIRPWIRIDGSLNRKVLDRLLGTVLGFIVTHPGSSLRAIMDQFSPSFTPVWIKDLVEILHDIGCVELTSFVVLEKATLFSKSVVQILDTYTGLEEDDCVMVESKVDAITTLGLFIGKKTYSKDFLTD